MPVDISISFEEIEEESETSRTYAIDWNNGRIIGFVDGSAAMRQFIDKVLSTPRFQCLIYSSEYGSELKDTLINKDVTQDYIEAEVDFLIEDALLHDERILGVSNIELTFFNTYPLQDSVQITFDVDTIFGEINVEEVI